MICIFKFFGGRLEIAEDRISALYYDLIKWSYDHIKSRSFQLSRVRSSAGNNFVSLGPFPKRKKSHLTKSLSNLTEQLVYFWSQGQEKEKVMVISDVFRKARISLEAGKCWNCPEIPAQTVIVSLLCDTWKATHVGCLRPLRKLSVLCLVFTALPWACGNVTTTERHPGCPAPGNRSGEDRAAPPRLRSRCQCWQGNSWVWKFFRIKYISVLTGIGFCFFSIILRLNTWYLF